MKYHISWCCQWPQHEDPTVMMADPNPFRIPYLSPSFPVDHLSTGTLFSQSVFNSRHWSAHSLISRGVQWRFINLKRENSFCCCSPLPDPSVVLNKQLGSTFTAWLGNNKSGLKKNMPTHCCRWLTGWTTDRVQIRR